MSEVEKLVGLWSWREAAVTPNRRSLVIEPGADPLTQISLTIKD